MHIYVINLDRSEQRMNEFLHVNSHMPGIHRFSAIDGSTVDRARLVEAGTVVTGLPYSDGAIGCALSHLFFWEAAVAEQTDITICEDDAIFHRSFYELASEVVASLPTDWDLILWGWNFDSILQFDLMPGVSPCLATFNQDQLRSAIDTFQATNVAPRAFRLHRAFGTVCYTISPRGARKLIDCSLPIRPFTVDFPRVNPAFPNNGIDIVMNAAYVAMNAFVSVPPLVVTKNEHAISTVIPGT